MCVCVIEGERERESTYVQYIFSLLLRLNMSKHHFVAGLSVRAAVPTLVTRPHKHKPECLDANTIRRIHVVPGREREIQHVFMALREDQTGLIPVRRQWVNVNWWVMTHFLGERAVSTGRWL